MLFSSLTFLVWFLPLVILLHMIVPWRMKNIVLLAASVFFYAWGEIAYVPLVLASMLVNYAFGFGCAAKGKWLRRVSLLASLLVNIGALVYFKYATFFLSIIGLGGLAPAVALPLGISFYTFQTQAYVVDVYRRKVPPERNFIDYATFILLFPQLIAGPIVLYTDVRRELKNRQVSAFGLESGMQLFIVGLSSKVLLANALGAMWEQIQALPSPSSIAAWLGIIAFGLQIYFDFAGYSLMAIGMGKMMGFQFPRNFNHPYASRSIRDFWRRWHMTLGGWFREYVYIPLGGSRKGPARNIVNLLIVWLLTGLWHGASWNFVAWGLWFFLFLVLERYWLGRWLDRHRRWALVYTLAVVFIGWVLFAHESLLEAWQYFLRMFSFSYSNDWLFPLRGNAVLLLISLVACLPTEMNTVSAVLERRPVLRTVSMLVLLCLCIAGLVGAEYNPFLYFRF